MNATARRPVSDEELAGVEDRGRASHRLPAAGSLVATSSTSSEHAQLRQLVEHAEAASSTPRLNGRERRAERGPGASGNARKGACTARTARNRRLARTFAHARAGHRVPRHRRPSQSLGRATHERGE